MNPLNSTLWVCLKRSSTTPFMAVLVWNWWSTMCGSLSTRNVEKVFTPHIIIQYLYISLYISYLYISLHISIYEYTTIGHSLSMFYSLAHPVVICRGWSQAWQLSIGHAWFAWNVLILFDLCDLNIDIFKLYIFQFVLQLYFICQQLNAPLPMPPAMFGLNTSIVCCAMISQASLVVYPWSSIFWEWRSGCRR